ncbi:hypothetical protein L873DRAFT_165726 [Choiromyces venosus 120613-1]|uniref:Uncharacterized protein n=1 Tax=Choiromyces venosus 120613-1 TaxID=1336337 RepID=A0A3N4K4Y3_9PEZI|nr:hypothetical protein L873DRAFT_165726 [Choiromyces venosus 120613-1]
MKEGVLFGIVLRKYMLFGVILQDYSYSRGFLNCKKKKKKLFVNVFEDRVTAGSREARVLCFGLYCTVCLSSGATFLSFGDYSPPRAGEDLNLPVLPGEVQVQ